MVVRGAAPARDRSYRPCCQPLSAFQRLETRAAINDRRPLAVASRQRDGDLDDEVARILADDTLAHLRRPERHPALRERVEEGNNGRMHDALGKLGTV